LRCCHTGRGPFPFTCHCWPMQHTGESRPVGSWGLRRQARVTIRGGAGVTCRCDAGWPAISGMLSSRCGQLDGRWDNASGSRRLSVILSAVLMARIFYCQLSFVSIFQRGMSHGSGVGARTAPCKCWAFTIVLHRLFSHHYSAQRSPIHYYNAVPIGVYFGTYS
jgi:hypothetical protein